MSETRTTVARRPRVHVSLVSAPWEGTSGTICARHLQVGSKSLREFLVLLVLSAHSSGCASQRNTGELLVYTGAATAVMGASAGGAAYCSSMYGCYSHKANKEAAKTALVGIAIAAAGYALIESADRDRAAFIPARASTSSSAPPCCRLVRKDGRALPTEEELQK